MLRQRATLRDLRLGNVGANDDELANDIDDAVATPERFERAEFFKELSESIDTTDLEYETLSLFRIKFDYVGTDEVIALAERETEQIGFELLDRSIKHHPEASLFLDTTERTLTGFFAYDQPEKQTESIVGDFLKDYMAPIEVDGHWVLLETRAACVTLNELKEQTTRSLVDALELTLNSTSLATSFLVYKPYLKNRHGREIEIEELLSSYIQNESVELAFEDIKSAKTQKTIGIEVTSRFGQDLDPESSFSNSEVTAVSLKSKSAFELGACVRRLAVTEFQDELKPGANSKLKLWFNISAADLANPNLVESLTSLNLPSTNIGLEIADHKILESVVAMRRIQAIKQLGFSLALDELEVTSPRLALLSRLPFDALKIKANSASPKNRMDIAAQLGYLGSLLEGLNIDITVTSITSASQAQDAIKLGATNIQGTFSTESSEAIDLG